MLKGKKVQKRLSELLCPEYSALLKDDPVISYITASSAACCSGAVFACIKGANTDGHLFVREAYDRGCRVFICEDEVELPEDATVVYCANTRILLAEMSAAFYEYPAKSLRLIAVTGTKGKTTVSYYIYRILNNAGKKTALIGTIGAYIDDMHFDTVNTTPDSPELEHLLTLARDAGCEYTVMEVSSQAIMQHRVHGLHFAQAVFTNLTPDHISRSEHKDFEDYRHHKAKLFEHTDLSVINTDDESAARICELSKKYISVSSLKNDADYYISNIKKYKRDFVLGIEFSLYSKQDGSEQRIDVKQPCDFSAYNAALAYAVAENEGVSGCDIINTLAQAEVAGRFEIIPLRHEGFVVIDYAHNGASLNAALEAMQTIAKNQNGRLICLFGAVGGKSEGRRKELARAAERHCDFIFLTSDNPDNEPQDKIISEIEDGFSPGFYRYVKVPDRETAVYMALRMLNDNDILMLAGKGNEAYQLVKGKRLPFSERKLVENYLKSMSDK